MADDEIHRQNPAAREFLCPQCGSHQGGEAVPVTAVYPEDDPWSKVTKQITCGKCGSIVPAFLAERWNHMSETDAWRIWREDYRDRQPSAARKEPTVDVCPVFVDTSRLPEEWRIPKRETPVKEHESERAKSANRETWELLVLIGNVLAVCISWQAHQSILLAVVHGFLGWLYVIFYVITR